jgi:small acid-soluble spore protein H (minor)
MKFTISIPPVLSRIFKRKMTQIIDRKFKGGMKVNINRAKEIAESADVFNVTYEGEPVIIQHVDEKSETARIYSKSNPEEEHEVSVLKLIEEV